MRQNSIMDVKLVRFLFIAVAVGFACMTIVWKSLSVATIFSVSMSTNLVFSKSRILKFLQSPSVAKVILPASVNASTTFHCRQANLMSMSFPICLYDVKTDDIISAWLLDARYFEEAEVIRFLQLLRSDRRLQLVDLGANVGLWSLPAARVTQVLAVEPNWHSMSRLAKAVDLGAVASNITLVHLSLIHI